MNRRTFVRKTAIGGAGLASVSVAITETSMASSSSNLTPPAFELDELTIADLQSGMDSGKYTAYSLARKYLDRIDDVDKHGPAINSVIELNPDALSIATDLDKERKAKGARGPLHGIPVLIKDNIDTHDRMTTTTGFIRSKEAARCRRSDSRQDKPERVGQLSFQPFNQRLERARRPNEKSLCARSQSLRFQFRNRRSRGRESLRRWRGDGNGWLGRLSFECEFAGRYQAHAGINQPRWHRAHRAQSGHGRADVPDGNRRGDYAGRAHWHRCP